MIMYQGYVLQETKLAFSSLLRLPSFSLTVMLTLALTLASLTVVLNINYLVLSKPLPYPDSSELIVTDQSETINGQTQYGYQLLSSQFHIYQDKKLIDKMALMIDSSGKLKDVKNEPRIQLERVTPEYFELLGMPIYLGRAFNEKEAINEMQRAMVLSYKTWQTHFKGDANIINTQTRLGNHLYTIVGVASEDFSAPEVFGHHATEAWVSFHYEVTTTSHWDTISGGINGIAKLKPGVSIEQANQVFSDQINTLYQGQQGVAPNTQIGASFVTLRHKIIGDSDEMATILLFGVIALLFIAVANISNLFLSRTVQKQRIMAIQAAVGARPSHLFWGMFFEAMLLIVASLVMGLIIAGWVFNWLENDLQYIFPRMHNLSLDGITIVICTVISVFIAFIIALLSTRQINYVTLIDKLHVSGKGTNAQVSMRTRNFLIATQVALATILLLGAAALLSPAYKKLTQPLGFNSDGVYQLRVDSGKVTEGLFAYTLQLKQALINLPQVEKVSRSLATPLAMGWENYLYDENNKMLGIVSTGMFDGNIFDLMEQPLLAGRSFSEIESQDAIPQEIIISQSLAKRLYGDNSALGKTLHAMPNEPLEVVGVVSDIYVPDRGYDYSVERYYTPYPGERLNFNLKLSHELKREEILNVLQSVEQSFSISRFESIDNDIEYRLRRVKLTAILTVALVSLALCLAAAGIYGVLSYSVQMRRFELGIRLSLGAHTHQLIAMVVKQSMKSVVIGISAGLLLTLIAHLVGSQIWVYQLRADMMTFVLALPIMAVTALLAVYWPVKKVIQKDPIKALRNE